VSLATPDKELVFELTPKPVEPEVKEEETEETDAEQKEEEKEEPPVEYEWKLAKGGLGDEHKQAALDSILRKLDSLSASDIVDPATKAEWGLEPPAFRCVVGFKDETEDVVIEGGLPDTTSDGYVRVATNTEDIVYKLGKYNYEQLWPKGKDLFELPQTDVKANDLERITIVNAPAARIVLAKQEDKWTVAQPAADLDVITSTLDTVARTLAEWKSEDYADAKQVAKTWKRGAPKRTVSLQAAGDKSHSIVVGNDSKSIDGVYAKLDGGETVLVMKGADVDKIFVSPNDLYDRGLFGFEEDGITTIQVQRPEDAFSLERKDDGWNLVIGGETTEADPTTSEDVVRTLADLEAQEIIFGKTALDGEPEVTIVVTGKDGAMHTILLGAEKDGARPLTSSGKEQLFTIESGDAALILPTTESLKKRESEPEPEPQAEEVQPAEKSPGEEAVEITVGNAPAVPVEVTLKQPAAAPAEVTIKMPPAAAEVTLEQPPAAPAEKPAP